MEKQAPTTTIYKGEMLAVWEDIQSVYLGFDSCIVIFPKGCWGKIKADFRKIVSETPPPDSTDTICGRRF